MSYSTNEFTVLNYGRPTHTLNNTACFPDQIRVSHTYYKVFVSRAFSVNLRNVYGKLRSLIVIKSTKYICLTLGYIISGTDRRFFVYLYIAPLKESVI